MLDEIQLVENFADVLNEFLRKDNVDIYYTSVNKSSLPLALDDYETYGGLPQIFDYSTEEEKSAFLKNLLEETYIRDIEEVQSPKK